MTFSLPTLDYPYDALEPYIDARTMEIHHSKHHAGYVNNANAALEGHPDLEGKEVEAMIKAAPDEKARKNLDTPEQRAYIKQLLRKRQVIDKLMKL